MILLEAIDLVVARTGVERYRYLCLEHPKPSVRAEYSRWIVDEAQRDPSEPDITAHLAEASAQPRTVRPCGGC